MEQQKNVNRLRFDSFELSDSEISQISLMNTILELQNFFPEKAEDFDKINEFIESVSEVESTSDDFKKLSVYNIKFMKKIRKDMQCTETLKLIRSLLEEKNSDEIVNWNLIVNSGKFDVSCYLTFVYYLIKLFEIDQNDKINKDLSFNAGRTYICLLSLPGAKTCMVWDRDLIMEYFKLLNIHVKFTSNDHYLELQIIQMLNEIKNVFNIVCLNDQEDVQEKYIDTICSLLEYYLRSNGHSAIETIMVCYDNLESLCLRPLPDHDVENIMYLIFCRSVELHFITSKKRQTLKAKHGEAISDFFLYLLSIYSIKTKNILLKFIKSLLSNPAHKYEREKFLKLLDVAAKYELAIYWKCNESIIEYLKKLSMSADSRHRLNCVEFCQKMLLIDTMHDSSIDLNLTTEVPREVDIIKILFERINDKQDNVKLKALTALKAGIVNGNDFAKKIFHLVFEKSKNDNPEILNSLGEDVENFQHTLLSLLQYSNATYIKKTCLEILIHNCNNLIDNEIFIDIIITLTDDPSYLVKIQLLELVNMLIKNNPKNNNAIELWIEVLINLMRDNDNKIVDAAIKALIGIFEKIESFENTVTDDHILPWTIIKIILTKRKRGLLKNAIDAASNNFLTQEKLRSIETHIFTSNHRTEAWCILSLIAKKIKSNNPDLIIKIFLDHITERNYETNDFHLILEVIRNWIETFSINSRAQMASVMTDVLKNGDCPISMVSHLYEICTLTRSTLNNIEDNEQFALRINTIAKKFVLENFQTFHLSEIDEKMLSYILIYCESNTDLSLRPDKKIIDLFFDFLKKILKNELTVSAQYDTPRKLNIIVVCLTRFAIRDNELAAELAPELASLLRKSVVVSVIKNTIQCLNDLCKKHTSTVAPVFREIIYKLHSKSEEIRLCALTNIYDLVMQDFIKMKGRVLINLLACIVDKNELIQLKSQAAILSYTNDKNPNLLYTCFIEAVFLFNNFIQADNFGVFPLDEIDQSLLLLNGDDKRGQRRELYQFFIQNIYDLNEIHLLLLLKQIILMKDRLDKKKYKNNVCGINAFKDVLYVFKLICEKQGESKMKLNKGGENGGADEEYEEEQVAQTSENAQKAGKKNKNQLTMNDAIQVVEKVLQIYPSFVKLIIEYDQSLKSSIDELTKSISINFASLIEYSKDDFWKNGKEIGEKSSNKGKKRKRRTIESDDDDNDSDDI
ncbi:hypothetical protein PVAND_001729 [Polypedilum vanderplanki]|uniref:Condensin complex subunit 1 C-terminal domain-containing protein n=1 Tax=Polypedilum vanderplanki TaxID=319348 RepID=A0A9J6BP94_POLVA|nr:hypothetical protein PVAND_001729 [Polypedilum vanderplanki]